MDVRHTAIDGSGVNFAGPLDLTAPPSSFAYGRSSRGTHEFTGGDGAFAEHVVQRDQPGFTVLEQYSYQGGELRLGVDLLVDPDAQTSELRRSAIWRGRVSSFKFFIHGGESSDLIAIADLLNISETSDSVVLSPRDASRTPFGSSYRPSGLFKPLPELGTVDVLPLTSSSARKIPNWRGQPVEGGELFRSGQSVEERILFLLGDTSMTRIYPDDALSDDRAIDLASKLVVSWEDQP